MGYVIAKRQLDVLLDEIVSIDRETEMTDKEYNLMLELYYKLLVFNDFDFDIVDIQELFIKAECETVRDVILVFFDIALIN